MEPETIVILIAIMGSVLGSTLTTIGLLLNQMGKFEGRLSARIDRLVS